MFEIFSCGCTVYLVLVQVRSFCVYLFPPPAPLSRLLPPLSRPFTFFISPPLHFPYPHGTPLSPPPQKKKQMVRKVGMHVEYPSRRYYGAFGLSFSLATVTDVLVERALRKPPPIPAPAAAAAAAAATGGAAGATAAAAGTAACAGVGKMGYSGSVAPGSLLGGEGGRGAGGIVSEEWTADTRRFKAGEMLGRRAIETLKVREGWW